MDGPVYFWRETQEETGFLSQWFYSPFSDPKNLDKIYKTAEHYMMHHKALLFGDNEIAAEVLRGAHPRAVKSLGRKVKNFDEEKWVANRERIVAEGTYAKFMHPVADTSSARRPAGNGRLLDRLLATGDRELVEASPYDPIWGIGLAEAHAGDNRESWGLNLLGKALMAVREQIKQERQEEEEV